MGTTTASGPCATQVGVGVGEMVKVGVMVAVGVRVADSVGVGSVVTVAVGFGAASTVPPQPANNIDTTNVNKISCLICLMKSSMVSIRRHWLSTVKRSIKTCRLLDHGLLIEFPNDAQAVQRKPGRDDVDHVSLFSDDFGQPACSDDFHVASQLGPKSCYHTLDHAHVPKQ
jgi:hypothetical protein